MEEHNRDIFPKKETVEAYKSIAPLIENKIVNDAFQQRENAANAAKALYHNVGRIAILLVAAGALFTVAEALIIPEGPYVFPLSATFAALSVVGLLLQFYIVLTKQKKNWMINRFAAERVRSIKFYGFSVADFAIDAADLQSRADDFYRKALAQLGNELNAGITALHMFSPSATVGAMESIRTGASSAPANPPFAAEARQAYTDLRVRYQARFASDEVAKLKGEKRLLENTSDLLYLFGACVVVLALGSKFVGWHTVEIDFIAVALFIISSSMAILENASLAPDARSRYERYAADSTEIERHGLANLSHVVNGMENLALRELDAFCRAAAMISYRL